MAGEEQSETKTNYRNYKAIERHRTFSGNVTIGVVATMSIEIASAVLRRVSSMGVRIDQENIPLLNFVLTPVRPHRLHYI
ncbi:hypothetical protein HK28_07145 [Acetobacter sp. DsW_063]|nr:hypothetical protein HK28_07145 [Acetobacter sp. DsW_063]